MPAQASCQRGYGSCSKSVRLFENNGPVAIHQDPMFGVPLHRLSKGRALDGTATLHKVLCGQCVIDALDALFTNRAFVEISRDAVSGCADEFHAPLLALGIRAGASQGR